MKSRLAPTPSGLLHEGNALNFVLTWWFTRFHKGELLLRIDDSDKDRTRTEYLEDIFEVIDWLGIDYDLGPVGVEDHIAHFSQTLKTNYYFEELQKNLKSELFNCSCSRKDLEGNLSYPGICLNKKLSFIENRTCIRFLEKQEGEFDRMVLWRKDNSPAYQFVSVIEDRDSRITDIIRGEDLLASFHFQKILFKKINDNPFPKTFHHRLILGANQEKLSKGQKSNSVRKKYKNKEDFFRSVLWPFLGKDFEGMSLEELKLIPPVKSIFKEAF